MGYGAVKELQTFGYRGTKMEDFAVWIEANDVVLVDIRLSPRARGTRWNRSQLSLRLGDRYVHVRALGNRNYKSDGPIALDDPAHGVSLIRELFDRHDRLCMVCACAELQGCHRADVARLLVSALGEGKFEIRHLARTDIFAAARAP